MTMQATAIPKDGSFCPNGYHTDGNMCVPDSNAKPAILKNGFCPNSWHTDQNYCVADSENPNNVIAKNGFCPNGWHTDGNYCVQD